MKIKPRLYAKSLAQVLSQTESPAEAQKVVSSFVQLLKQNKQLRDWPKIARLFDDFYDQETHQLKAHISSPIELTATQNQTITQWLAQQFPEYTLTPEYTIDPQLLGGLTAQVGHTFYDLSLKRQLHQYLKQLNQ